ncbi:MAG: XrtA/PEP-CTERM system TPR-repeat protein PrsT [Paraglaciecola sp.]|uniref:XrtA/PEP-CTERM system TPR-repeat protein PrsT n=2 Tax=Paraglaciecola sp. TaxID=1920173 RepID=UPI003297C9C4
MIKSAVKIAFILLILSSCEQKNSHEFIEQANVYIAEEKLNDAEITLKSAIKKYPQDKNLRAKLGTLYLSQGLATLSEKELRRALELGLQDDKTILKYLKSLAMQRKVEDTLHYLESLSTTSPSLKIASNTYKGISYIEQNYTNKARAWFTSAIEEDVKYNKYQSLAKAYLAYLDQDLNSSIKLLDNILSIEPDFAEALVLKSRIHYLQQRFTESAVTLEIYLNYYANAHWSRIYYAQALVRAENYDKANIELKKLLALFPNQPLINQLKAVVEFENKHFLLAKEYSEKALQFGDKQDTTKFIAGVSAMQLGNYEQAYSYLESLVKKAPINHPIHKIFSIAQLKVGNFEDAATTLEQVSTSAEEDFELYTSISYGLMKSGQLDKAKDLIAKTESTLDGSYEMLTRLGQLKLSVNDLTGINDLKESLEKNSNQLQAKLMLATAYIQINEFDKAINLALNWQADEPHNIETKNLEAYIYYKQGKLELAAKAYLDSLLINKSNFRAYLFLKNKLLSEGELQLAAKKMEQYIEIQPNDVRAYLHLYLIRKEQGKGAEFVNYFKKQYETYSTREFKIALARLYNSERMYIQAVNLLKTSEKNEQLPEFYWRTLALAEMNLPDFESTIKTLNSWLKSFPNSVSAIYFKTIALEKSGHITQAIEELSLWNSKNQNNQMYIAEALLQLKVSNILLAERSIQKVTDQNLLKTATGLYAQGRIAAANNANSDAKELLFTSYQLLPESNTAIWLSEQIKLTNGTAAAIEFLQVHLASSVNDVIARTQLANIMVEANDDRAYEQYSKILELAPENVIALNNLAWHALQKNQLYKAEVYAEKALTIASTMPDILDTAAAVKIALDDTESALRLLEKAYKIDNAHLDVAIHYAQLLTRIGDTETVLEILKNISPKNAEQRTQIDELRKQNKV